MTHPLAGQSTLFRRPKNVRLGVDLDAIMFLIPKVHFLEQ